MLKQISMLALAAAIVVMAAVTIFAMKGDGDAVRAAESKSDSVNTITVTGKGEIKVDPDVAYISFGIQTRATTAKEAQTLNAQMFAKVEDVLYNQYKFDKKDVKTSNFSVRPEYKYEQNKEPVITGYTVSNMVQVTYRELDQIGTLLDALSVVGVNQVNGIQFSSENLDDYEIQVIDRAMANAEAKAAAIAKTEDRSVQRVLNVIQGHVQQNPFNNVRLMANESLQMADSANSTPISAGQLTVTTSVTVQYEF